MLSGSHAETQEVAGIPVSPKKKLHESSFITLYFSIDEQWMVITFISTALAVLFTLVDSGIDVVVVVVVLPEIALTVLNC